MSRSIRSTAQRKDDKGRVRHGGEWLAIWSDPNSLKTDAERRADDALAREFADRQRALAASARSVSARTDVEVTFGGPSGRTGISLPSGNEKEFDRPALRGAADAQATFLRYHDHAFHREARPSNEKRARLFDLLELLRCNGLGARRFQGIEENLTSHQIRDLQSLDLMHAHLASLIPLREALRMVCRDVFVGRQTVSIDTAGLRIWDRWLRDRFTSNFTEMKGALHVQPEFADASKSFILALLEELPNGGEIDRRLDPTKADSRDVKDDDQLHEAEDDGPQDLREAGEHATDEEDGDADAGASYNVALPEPYRIFTNRYDRIVQAKDLSDQVALRAARKALDEKQADLRKDIARLSVQLQRKLLSRQARQWEFDQDDGLVDASRLDRVIVKPGFSSCFKYETSSPFLDTVVTLLIDNSGSMRGKPIETACIVADVLAAALERCSISTEVLGFTTQNWKGGQSAKDWRMEGKADNPGRLNDLLHIIYKDATTPLRRARDSICAMLSPSLLKENIDGEALSWAAARLLERPEQRRVLIVVSDGAPMDQATFDANSDKAMLDRHLRDTIAWIETSTNIELTAIGIRHNLEKLYRRSVTINDVDKLGAVLVASLDEMLLGPLARTV